MSPLDLVPKEYHLATIVGTSLIGFLLILVISSLTAKPIDSEPPADSDTSAEPKTPGKKRVIVATPEKRASEKVTAQKLQSGELGAVSTPAGKRSLRIAAKKQQQ
uniref:Uncharacterized protein n=1 Tax=Leptocylindrus danicus TaxID=163516 RepID=A0A7S2LBI3_9STRA|mmetsp:Transcript_34503/g.50075  ORF Transcript_34503/g.50075 Transcript_34503/m.50075 type:complete len:105 (+) Transcript_34503:81-395(+)|eukprot:CAMPEP_0116019494 /NCGR_PEP_ID=MMETSP0321-20121206/9270_1 /TAXON_ID=163516 /ORGANISM="Leptocylindrus danicus var. danicus, Strain B650" /LENGTH=104 /DNA_ID=CAMNT_0003490075 /DNA_START=28 /DNA_END=342 /DNA_ORIENTATION=-